MNTRLCSVIAAATLLTISSGCSGMRDFLFGRGARCGLCRSTPAPIIPPAPVPYAPPPATCPPPMQGVVTAPPMGCGCNEYVTGSVHAGMPCGNCGTICGDCGCGCSGAVESYGPVVNDPYLSGQVMGGPIPQNGQIISDQVIGQSAQPPVLPGATMPPAPIQPDDFSARKFDSDGNRILWEQPLPDGASSL